jgi:hypothetical protein
LFGDVADGCSTLDRGEYVGDYVRISAGLEGLRPGVEGMALGIFDKGIRGL